jgi:integrase
MGLDGLVEKDTKTHSLRTVAVDGSTADVLNEHRSRTLARLTEAGLDWAPAAFVFASTIAGSTPWFPDSASRRFRRLCEEAGVRGVRLHDLRHYVATRLLAAGVDVRTVAGRLGHRNAATTLNVYAHFLADADRDAAGHLGDVRLVALANETSGT